jgi:hypothetical protein
MARLPRIDVEDRLLTARRRSVAKAARQERDQRNREHRAEIYLLVGEPEAAALVAGFVPPAVKAQARAALDWEFPRPSTAALHGVLRTPRGKRGRR